MKKILVLAALLPLLFACTKQPGTNNGRIDPADAPALPPTPSKEYAAKFDIPAQTELFNHFRSIEFTGEGNYTLVMPAKDDEGKPIADEVLIKSGTYKIGTGSDEKTTIYELTDDNATVTVQPVTKFTLAEMLITISYASVNYQGAAIAAAQFDNTTFNQSICRVWQIVDTDLMVQGANGFSFGKIYQGCDFEAITKDLADQKINIDASKFAGLKVNTIEISESKTLKIVFTNGSEHYGDFTSFDNNGNFAYKVAATTQANIFFDGNVTGSVSFQFINRKIMPVLSISSSFKEESTGKVYDTQISFTLKQQ